MVDIQVLIMVVNDAAPCSHLDPTVGDHKLDRVDSFFSNGVVLIPEVNIQLGIAY